MDPAPPKATAEHPVVVHSDWTGGFLNEEAYQWVRPVGAVVQVPADAEAAKPAPTWTRGTMLGIGSAEGAVGDARGRARAAGRDEVAARLIDELAEVPPELMDAGHAILVESSAGKDALVHLHRIATWAEKAGCRHKVVVALHAEVCAEAERLEREEGPLVWSHGDAVRQHLGASAADDYLARVALAA